MSSSEIQGQRKLEQIGLQLSTITPLLLKDFEGALATVAETGYDLVEFSAMGFLGRSPQQVEQLLLQNGLQAPVGRVAPLLPDGFMDLPRKESMKIFRELSRPENLIDNVKYSLEGVVHLGQKYLNLPVLMPDNFTSLDQVKQNIELINAAGEICAEQGVQFGYHNHNWELIPIDGVVPYDLMLAETDKQNVSFQIDAYWIVKGGGDLSHYLTTHAGRFPTCHLKDIDDNGDFADVGSGQIDFPAFVDLATKTGSIYYFVEHDAPADHLDSIKQSLAYLRQMTF